MTQNKIKPVAPEKRQFSLILALVASPEGLTREQLLASVYGYANDFEVGVKNTSLERKFERDKDQLRALGFPIETIDSPGEPGNNQLMRYRISKDELQLPADISFTKQELLLLRSAALAWRDTSLDDNARRAIMKLESIHANLDVRQLGVAPQVVMADPATQVLHAAIHAKNRVKFRYSKAGQDHPEVRNVSPYRLHRAEGRWHLVGFDHDRDAWRTFLISRILGEVKRNATAEFYSGESEADAVVDELVNLQRSQPVSVRVKKGSIALTRLAARAIARQDEDETVVLNLETLDYDAFADELISFTRDVSPLTPGPLVDAYRARIRKMLALHE